YGKVKPDQPATGLIAVAEEAEAIALEKKASVLKGFIDAHKSDLEKEGVSPQDMKKLVDNTSFLVTYADDLFSLIKSLKDGGADALSDEEWTRLKKYGAAAFGAVSLIAGVIPNPIAKGISV